MAQIREIKNRRAAVGTIQRITKTMQMIATAKFTAAVQRAQATRPFADHIARLTGEVTQAAGEIDDPLATGPSERMHRELVLIITSDRGLCGAYNANVLRQGYSHVKEREADGVTFDLESSGRKAIGFFKFNKITALNQYSVGDRPSYEDVERIANHYMELFRGGEYDSISVVYMRYISNARQVPEVLQLLPLRPPQDGEGAGDVAAGGHATYEFSPSAEALVEDLLPLTVKSQLFQAFNDAVVSEQVMRMIAMKAATDNARDLGKMLSRQFNRARQARITTELTEIVGGTAALE